MCPCTELSSWEHSSSSPHDGAVTCVWKGALITSKLVFGRQYIAVLQKYKSSKVEGTIIPNIWKKQLPI